MANKNEIMETVNNTMTTIVTVNDKQIADSIFSEREMNKLSKTVDSKSKNGVVSDVARDYAVECFKKVNTLADKSTWSRARVVYNIRKSDSFDKAFKDFEDFYNAVGLDKSTISRMINSVDCYDELISKGYRDLSMTQVAEMLSYYNEHKKKELDFKVVLDFIKNMYKKPINKLSCKNIREGIKAYKNSLVHEIESDENEDIQDENVSRETNDENTENVSRETQESLEGDGDLVRVAIENTKSINVDIKKTSGKIMKLEVRREDFERFYNMLIENGFMQ